MRAAVLQSNYIPWKGYFDIIHDVDVFVFHDDLQYTKGDWRNRNRIKAPSGPAWLTIPVGASEHRRICDVHLPSGDWARAHWRRIEASYRRAPYFSELKDYFEPLYLARRWRTLAELNQTLIAGIARDLLGIGTRFLDSRDFDLTSAKGARLLDLLGRLGADTYVSGPAAKAYIDADVFEAAGIRVEWKAYRYPEYPQLHGPFVHEVSILDLLVHTGPEAPRYIWGVQGGSRGCLT